MTVPGKKRKVKMKPGACIIVKGHKTFDGETWTHHDYEVCMTKSGITSRRIGSHPDDTTMEIET